MIENYFLEKRHKLFDGRRWLYKYSSNKGKFGLSNLLMEGLVQNCSGTEVKLMVAILSKVKQGRNIFESGCVKLVSTDYEDVCSRPVFSDGIAKFVELGYLVPTLETRWYILNPRYINKFYNLKAPKGKKGDDKKQ